MSLLDRMKDSVSSAGIGVSQKFSCTAETMKLNNKIRNNEKEIEKLIVQVGQRCLELHFGDDDSEYEEFFSEIRRYQAENERHRAEIQRLSEEEQEQARQRQLEMQQQREQERKEREAQKQQEALLKQKEALLKQQKAQLKQQKLQESLDQVIRICPKCGERNDLNAKFCVYCGNPFANGNSQQEETQQDVSQAQTETKEALLKQQEAQLQQQKLQESLDPMIRICPKCGERNDLNAKFCVYCGNPFANGNSQQEETQQDVPQAQTETKEALLKQQEAQLQQQKLQESLDPVIRICSKCGERNDLNAKFCVYCGNPFANGNSQQEETQQDVPQAQTETTE